MFRFLAGFLAAMGVACASGQTPQVGATDAGARTCPGSNPVTVNPATVTVDPLDKRARVIRGAMPSIPSALFKPGARGRAVMSFVVDTLGQVEPRSSVILHSTASQWGLAVCRALPRIRYASIAESGALVRARMTQIFEYYVDPAARVAPPPA